MPIETKLLLHSDFAAELISCELILLYLGEIDIYSNIYSIIDIYKYVFSTIQNTLH